MQTTETACPVIGISMGDPAGVGPELCLRALADPRVRVTCRPVLFGDADVLRLVAARCGLPFPAAVVPAAAWFAAAAVGPVIADCGAVAAAAVVPGRVSAACGRAAYRYVIEATRAATRKLTRAVVTAPLHKESLAAAGVPYPGHTEILAAETGTDTYCMMLASESITVSLVTAHMAYADVPRALTAARIEAVIGLTVEAMRRRGLDNPRVTVCGLNPHAGENGLFGDQERTVIAPAVAAAKARGITVTGPLPPDTAFIPAWRSRTDVYVAMTHDQGLAPFKMLAFETGVNITLGLPIIRTSVDHGTAFDRAWQGTALPGSLLAAIEWAVRLAHGSPAPLSPLPLSETEC